MMYSALEDHKFRERFFEIHRSPHLRAIRSAIQSGIEQGIFRRLDPALTVRSFLWGLIQYCVQSFVARTTPVDPPHDDQMTQNLVSIFLDGLMALPETPQGDR